MRSSSGRSPGNICLHKVSVSFTTENRLKESVFFVCNQQIEVAYAWYTRIMYLNREDVARMFTRGKDSTLSYFKNHYQSPSVQLHWKNYLRDGLIVLALVGAVAMMFRAGAATYTFVQGSWAGGVTANTANHGSNRTGWTQFASSSNIVSGSSLTLAFATASTTQQGTSFQSGTHASTALSGSGASTLVALGGTGGESGAIISTHVVGSQPWGIVYDSTQQAIWVAKNGGSDLAKLDATTGALIGDYAPIAAPRYLAYHPGTNTIWNTSSGNSFSQKINAATGAGIASYSLGTASGIAVSPNAAWVSTGGSGLHRVNVTTGAITSSSTLSSIASAAYSSADNALFFISTGSLVKLNPDTFTEIVRYGLPVGPTKLIYDPIQNVVWMGSTNSGVSTVIKINPANGSVVSTTTLPGTSVPEGMVYDSVHNAVWVAQPAANTVTKINAATGAIVGTYAVGTTPREVTYDPVRDFVWVSNTGSTTVQKLGSGITYNPSGTFTSGVIDTGSIASFTTVNYNATVTAGQTVSIDVRSGNTATPDGTWSGWVTGLSSGGNISSLLGRYVQYRLNLTTNSSLVSPSVSSVTINYNAYSTSGTLISSPFDSGSPANLLSSISWTATTPSGTAVKFQMRTAPDNEGVPGTWSSWMGTDGTSGSYFTLSNGSESMPAALRDATNDQWIQYSAVLTQDSGVTPTLSGVTVTYVVNDPPQFDGSFGGTGVIASQVATSSDSNIGKVFVQYKIRDTDTTTGSLTPGFVTPSFEYDIGGGWVAIPSQNLSAGALADKSVNESAFTLYEAHIDLVSLLANTYTTNAKIRVKINDNEGANNITYGISAPFVLDTKAPVISSMHIDGTSATSTVTFSANDDTPIRGYIVSNNSDFTPDGTNLVSGIEQAVGTSSVDSALPWTLPLGSTKTVYVKVIDTRGNTSTRNVVVPATPSTIEFRDLSNVSFGSYREFIAWNIYPTPAPAGAAFGSYQLYRSTDGVDYSLVFNGTNPEANYYIDLSVSTSTLYYYKVAFVTDNGDKTRFSPVVSDEPDGKGGTNNGALPLISAITAAEVKNTSAKITWTTDELALSEVDFGTSNTYGRVATNRSYVTDHAVYLTGLTPNTTYYYRVRAIDAFSVSATDSNNGNGYTFTTGGGPVITNVTVPSVNDVSAEVSWKTNIPADSYVYFSTSPALEAATQMGSSDLVQDPFQHSVVLTGLTTDTLYYYKVTSTDANGNTTVDDNNGVFYTLRTTNDTRAPVISDVIVPVKASNGAVVTWKTDELSSSKVEYGVTSGASSTYTFSTDEITTPTIFHSVTLSPETAKQGGGTNELTKQTKYYYRVKSTDPAGNTTYSAEGDFTTTEDGAVNTIIAGGGGGYAPVDQDKDTTRPTISDVKVTDVGPFSATVTFVTDEVARSIIQYGTTIEYGSSAGSPTLTKEHKVVIRGLKMGTKYHFAVNAVDKAGNISISADQEFQTTNLAEDLGKLAKLEQGMDSLQEQIENLIESALPSVNPPFIEKPTVEEIGEDFARITWRTNVRAYGTIMYAEDAEYARTGQYTTEQSKTDTKNIDHVIDLSNLKPNTKYRFKVKSYVFIGADAQSADMTFTTKAGRVQPQVRDRKKDSMRVVWDTPVPTNSIVSYKVRGSQFASRKQDEGMTTSHEILLDNLAPKTTYEIRVSGTTADGNLIEARDTIVASTNEDTTPPSISNFKVDSALVPGRNDRTQTIVSWKTDEPATSVVYYEEGPGSATAELSQTKDNGLAYTDNHVVILTNLKPGTIYRFQIISVDDANNMSKLPVRTIVTPSQSESIVDVIFKNFDDTFKFMRSVR